MPPSNLPEPAQPWGRRHDKDHVRYDQILERLDNDSLNGNKYLNAQVNQLNSQVEQLNTTTDTLLALQTAAYSEFTTGIAASGVGFMVSPTSVSLTSSTGRVEIGFGGALNSGQGYFCYQIIANGSTYISRVTTQANIAQRVAITGGASFTPSGFNTVVVAVPVNQTLVISLEMYSGLAGTFFAGGGIRATVSL
jgi:hypothetical protein